jgi:nucleotide-binding universal stress UspA family protein
MRFRNILFPTDYSNLSRTCEPYVRYMAEHFGAALHVLHAVEIPITLFGVSGEYFLDTNEAKQIMEEARRTLQKILPDFPAEREVVMGQPARVIEQFIESNNIDMVMMPTHGYGPFRRALIGSTAAKVLHDVKCAVWNTAHTDAAVKASRHINRIVCGVDLIPQSVDLIVHTAELAESFHAEVWLAHSVSQVHTVTDEFGSGGTPSEWAENLQRYYIDFAREEIAKLQIKAGTNFPVIVEPGTISAVLADVARKQRADLLTIGRSGHGFLGHIRSHAYPIVHESPCPVLSW